MVMRLTELLAVYHVLSTGSHTFFFLHLCIFPDSLVRVVNLALSRILTCRNAFWNVGMCLLHIFDTDTALHMETSRQRTTECLALLPTVQILTREFSKFSSKNRKPVPYRCPSRRLRGSAAACLPGDSLNSLVCKKSQSNLPRNLGRTRWILEHVHDWLVAT